MLSLLLVSMLSHPIDNGYDPDKNRDNPKGETSEPAISVRGTLYYDNIEIPGTIYQDEATDNTGIVCNQQQEADCWLGCEAELVDPFCCQSGSWCEGTSNGGAYCHCAFFCARDSGGGEHKPKRLMVLPEGDR